MMVNGFILLLSLISGDARALSVEDAYRAIPHQRTVFDRDAARKDGMSAEDAASLVALFALVDEAIIAKVELGRATLTPRTVMQRYEPLLGKARALAVKGPLDESRNLVIQAIVDHQEYFLTKASGERNPAGAHAPQVLIQRSSQHLHKAYDVLMKAYPAQKAAVKQAFFDYLCALDFI